MPVPSTIADLSTTAASNSPAGTDLPSTLDDHIRALGSFIAYLRDSKQLSMEATLASAATTDIGAAASYAVKITGTTTITSFGTDGQGPRFIRFTGALTLTHNASSLILPGGANITTAAGDTCIAIPIPSGAGWYVSNYTKADGTPLGTSASLAANGYQKLPGGLILQWGAATSSAGGAQTVTLPITFPTAIRNVQVTAAITGQPMLATTDSQSTSSFTFSVWNLSGSRVAVGAYWIAIGY
jgi:hypothetical protein